MKLDYPNQIHGANLNDIFHTSLAPSTLYRRLHYLEERGNRVATLYCNGDIKDTEFESVIDEIMRQVDKILRYTEQGIPVMFNRDPRGYALKIESDYARNLTIYRDWGGYGIIAPLFDEVEDEH